MLISLSKIQNEADSWTPKNTGVCVCVFGGVEGLLYYMYMTLISEGGGL